MRILHLSMDYPPRMAGGTTIHTYQLCKAEAELGHEVTVVAEAAKGAPAEEFDGKVKVVRVGRPYTYFSGRAAKRLLKDHDVVHGHGTCARGHLSANDFPTVVKMHNTWKGEMERHKRLGIGEGVARGLAMRMYTNMDKFCVTKADHIIAISDVTKHETMAYGVPEEKITVIHNGIDLARFRIESEVREAVRSKTRMGRSNHVVVGYIGRLERHKNVEEVVEAIKGIEGADLLVVGGGDDEARIHHLAAPLGNRVHMTGFVPYDQVPRYYAACDIIVYPSLYEPLGNVILESNASGKPIIASNVDGIPEIFEEGTGYLVEPKTGQLKERIAELVGDDKKRHQMGRHGLSMVGRHSWTEVARKTAEVLGMVVEKRHRTA